MAQFIQADAAIDVGDTLVGMHVRPVAVPVRMEGSEVGQAHVTMAYSRLPYIGGQPGAVSQRLMRQRTITKPGADRHRLSAPGL